jgi:hypothetical protein
MAMRKRTGSKTSGAKLSAKVGKKKPTRAAAPRARPAGVSRAPGAAGASRTTALAALPYADETVRDRTGRGWVEWFAALDAEDATRLSHTDMVRLLADRHPAVSGWWLQGIVVGYERARGLRAKHETATGFNATASKTIAAPVERVYEAWSDPTRRRRWLGITPLEVIGSTPKRSLRAKWGDGSRVDVRFYAKGAARSQVTVDQTKLPDADAVARMKALWRERLETLREMLE